MLTNRDLSKNDKPSRKTKRNVMLAVITGCCFILITVFLLMYPFGITMQLVGEEEMTIEVMSSYIDPGCEAFDRDLDISQEVIIEDEVNPNLVGTYQVTYAFQAEGKWSNTISRTVHVVDTTAPELTLRGSDLIFVPIGNEYKEYGCTALDLYEGDLSNAIMISGEVDINVPDTYQIVYEVSDSSGNTATIIRTVQVSDYDPLRASLPEFTLDGFFPNTILTETKDGGQEYIEGTIFVGDSIIGNLGYFELIPIENIWTRSSLTPENIWGLKMNVYDGPSYGTFLDNVSAYQPKRIILTIGVSGSGWMTPEYFILKYGQLIDEIKTRSPQTQIIIGSILPIDKQYDTEDEGFSNKKINDLNYYIAQMCEEKGVKFLNMATAMKDENGQAKPGYTYDSDGIHPKTVAYEEILLYIRTHMYQE